ncbi:MAG: glycosyltransferase family 2 protein [Nitrospirota bacterium]
MEARQESQVQNQELKAWPKVAIIVLNWNGLKDTIECLESLKKITYPNYEVIVVDNGSKGNDADVLEEKYKDYIKVIRNKENLGFTGGNNVAIHYAIYRKYPVDYVFLLNNDAIIEKDCLTHLVSVACKTNAGIVGAIIVEESASERQFAGCSGNYPLIRQFFQPLVRWPFPPHGFENDFWTCFWVSGAAMLIRKETLRDVYASTGRYLNNQLFLYGDELDFCTTARKLGYESITTKQAIVYHPKRATSSGGKYNPVAYYYCTRNHILLAREMLPIQLKVFFYPSNLLICLIQILKNIIYRRFYSAWAIIYGFWDAYKGVTGKWKYHDQAILKCRGLK